MDMWLSFHLFSRKCIWKGVRPEKVPYGDAGPAALTWRVGVRTGFPLKSSFSFKFQALLAGGRLSPCSYKKVMGLHVRRYGRVREREYPGHSFQHFHFWPHCRSSELGREILSSKHLPTSVVLSSLVSSRIIGYAFQSSMPGIGGKSREYHFLLSSKRRACRSKSELLFWQELF